MKNYEKIRLQIEKDKALLLIVIGALFIVIGIIETIMFIRLAMLFG